MILPKEKSCVTNDSAGIRLSVHCLISHEPRSQRRSDRETCYRNGEHLFPKNGNIGCRLFGTMFWKESRNFGSLALKVNFQSKTIHNFFWGRKRIRRMCPYGGHASMSSQLPNHNNNNTVPFPRGPFFSFFYFHLF